MSQEYKLSLPAAILININIMLGAGIFINTAFLAHYAGALGSFSYIIIGLLMLPLILSIAELLRMYPGGSFYDFGKNGISAFAGFFSGWSYFVSKLASATLMIHTSISLAQQMIPTLQHYSSVLLSFIILVLFIALNMKNLKTGSTIQAFFMAIKTIPLFFGIFVGLMLFSGANFAPIHFVWSGLPQTIPLVLYATVGFEAACLLSSKIENPEKNAPRAVLISYAIVIGIAVLYQTFFYGALGEILESMTDFRLTFPALFYELLPTNLQARQLLTITSYLAIASSALGGAYGILFSNNWNIYSLAQNKHLFFSSRFLQLNRNNIPWLCVLLEGVVCGVYLLVTQGSQLALQQMGALGIVIAYTISVLSLLAVKKIKTSRWIPILGTFNCLLLIASCIHGLMYKGTEALVIFGILCIFGVGMFYTTKGRA